MNSGIFLWKKAPFIRLLIPLISGIILQWYGQFKPGTWYIVLAISIMLVAGFFYFPLFKKFRYGFLSGLGILLPFTVLGALLVWLHDTRHSKKWLGGQPYHNAICRATLQESPVEKTRSVKAVATISFLLKDGKNIPTDGKIIIYFRKDTLLSPLEYGSRLLFRKPLQEIRNSGNPGGFDYKRYALFQGITHQVYLSPGEFVVIPGTDKKWLPILLEKVRKSVLTVLRRNIPGEKELGLAEALLIGYKNDLDKTLVQSYTNTGVVHIIAISGLHLGLIYCLLVGLLKPLQRKKYARWFRPFVIISGLWLFSLLAGAQPSILRSAVMFTCIVLGENIGRRTSIYNTLAFSAFLLLCYNPFWLWDIGFQLSYSAVLSIVVFMQPVYNLLYIKNKLLDLLWKMNAVTLAAQILTIPFSIYHFHQLPTLFVLTNFVAVPLSSIILLSEILLCIVFFLPWLAIMLGRLINWLISLMNGYIERIEGIYFSLWDDLQINLAQAIFVFIFITGISYWLLEKSRMGCITGLAAISVFFVVRSYSLLQSSAQQKVIVYNVPRHQAVDFINGRRFTFKGDKELVADDFVRNFHLKPSRTLHRIVEADSVNCLWRKNSFISLSNKKIMLVDSAMAFSPLPGRIVLDLLVISRNPALYISNLSQTFHINQIVFDGSVPAWKLKYWKKDCDSLRIPYHDVTEKGAFVMNLN